MSYTLVKPKFVLGFSFKLSPHFPPLDFEIFSYICTARFSFLVHEGLVLLITYLALYIFLLRLLPPFLSHVQFIVVFLFNILYDCTSLRFLLYRLFLILSHMVLLLILLRNLIVILLNLLFCPLPVTYE